jgi:16S rRNA (guanine966-N2)-methyltransferase
MRIIAGQARGRTLRAPRGEGTRPTSDRVREAIFSAVEARLGLEGARVVDLFAGSGALGLEALSRGAARTVFVERDAEAARAILENARDLGLEPRCRVIREDALRAARDLAREGACFDLVLCDPPYADDPVPVLGALLGAGGGGLSPSGLLVLERSGRRRDADGEAGGAAAALGLSVLSTRRYGDTAVALLGLEGGGPQQGGLSSEAPRTKDGV